MIPRLLISVGVLLGVGAAAVQAHEVRQIGAYTLAVGFRAEPAFEDVANAVDIFINRMADNKALSVRDGDSVDLQVEVQFRDAEDIAASILAAAPLQEKPSQDFAASNRYNAWFKPTHNGTYAFRITGSIADTSDAKRERKRLMPPLCAATGRRVPPPALTAWPIRNPSLAPHEMAIGITRHSRRTRALRSPGTTPRTPVAGPGLLGS
jgi:uncharacterized protein YggL (DUF469 family)